MLGDAGDLGERATDTYSCVQVVEVVRVGRGADTAGLGDAVGGAPQAAVVAEVEQRRGGLRNRRECVLRGRDPRGSVAAIERVGGCLLYTSVE